MACRFNVDSRSAVTQLNTRPAPREVFALATLEGAVQRDAECTSDWRHSARTVKEKSSSIAGTHTKALIVKEVHWRPQRVRRFGSGSSSPFLPGGYLAGGMSAS